MSRWMTIHVRFYGSMHKSPHSPLVVSLWVRKMGLQLWFQQCWFFVKICISWKLLPPHARFWMCTYMMRITLHPTVSTAFENNCVSGPSSRDARSLHFHVLFNPLRLHPAFLRLSGYPSVSRSFSPLASFLYKISQIAIIAKMKPLKYGM